MALIVAPDAGAEAYTSVAAADAYHAARGNTAWAALIVPQKEQALRRATDYMVAQYSGRWRGEMIDPNQSLDWPRYGAWINGWLLDNTTIPAAIINACAELALRASTAPLYADVGPQEVTSERVGPIAVTYAARNAGQTLYPAVDEMLARYLSGGRGQTMLVRG